MSGLRSSAQNYQSSNSDNSDLGLLYGFVGVLGFSLTLPATRAAVADFDPIVVGLGRGVLAALLAVVMLWVTGQTSPSRRHIPSLSVVAIGVVLGFPVLSAWAMQRLPSAHGAVVLGLLPLATAIAGVIRTGDRPSKTFWLASAVGSATVVGFTLGAGTGGLQWADLVLIGAVVAAAFGYAEGGRLAQQIGGWQVICWALVLAAPFEVPFLIAATHGQPYGQWLTASPSAWLGFAYVTGISQFLAFFPWYHGLAIGGVARVGQTQLLQPFLTLLASAFLLGETITPITILAAGVVVASVAIGRRAKIQRSRLGLLS